MSLMNNNDRQAELDAVRQKIVDAVKANDAAAFSSALTEYGQLIETSILAEAEKSADAKIQAATQHIDSEVLRSRGVRQLTSAETGYWQKVTEAMKSTNPKQAPTPSRRWRTWTWSCLKPSLTASLRTCAPTTPC